MEDGTRSLIRVDADCWAWASNSSAPSLAQAWSREAGGQWWVGAGTVTHNRGGRITYYIHAGRLPAALQARRAAIAVMGDCKSWTVGGVARSLLSWVGEAQRTWRCTEDALTGLAYGYLYCRPGAYEDMVLVDLQAAFWEALCRLPSLRVTWIGGKPLWGSMTAEERARWGTVKERLACCKVLRNTMVGCMLGSNLPAVCYCKGERLRMPKRRGPFRGAAMTVVRAVYELTYLQRQASGAVYANTDNLLVARGDRLEVWKRYGFPYREQAAGAADVVRLGCYQVGDHSTYWYARGSRLPVPHLHAPTPSKLTLPHWQ